MRSALPADTTVVVISEGDELLELGGREGWHFPQRGDGVCADRYPADSTAAIAYLEALRVKGEDYLLFPGSALWWFERYEEFGQHLDAYITDAPGATKAVSSANYPSQNRAVSKFSGRNDRDVGSLAWKSRHRDHTWALLQCLPGFRCLCWEKLNRVYMGGRNGR